MYRLAEVELATLYPCIREVALNRGYQGCFKTKSNLSIVCDKGRQPSLRQIIMLIWTMANYSTKTYVYENGHNI
ncbi:hypothetical protein T4A_579 [Trichinella pseudospiralis]|uniref:Uncharacterized protein n=1 Tax=Trichinella pseudospiralis TaxID=6337 RepID=A0A0V1JCD6_TRIPS|nr:hypothetical protein T4A_579 [Trichinella pseudospiralis]KRZ32652.1 hypothetical protein T4C_12553 [Trichinella pseudospiralis]